MPDGGRRKFPAIFYGGYTMSQRVTTPTQYNIRPVPVNRPSVQAEGPSRPIGAVPTSREVGHLFTRLLSAVPTSWEVGH
jgi:hypothetical protein